MQPPHEMSEANLIFMKSHKVQYSKEQTVNNLNCFVSWSKCLHEINPVTLPFLFISLRNLKQFIIFISNFCLKEDLRINNLQWDVVT